MAGTRAANLDLECTEADFEEISRKVAGYHQYKNLLGLTQAEIDGIEQNPANFYIGIQGRFCQTLIMWKSKLNAHTPKRYATFRELVAIARKINDGLAIREFETICTKRTKVNFGFCNALRAEEVMNVEHQTMVQCTEILVNELSASVNALGDIFQAKGFLAPEIYETITSDRHDKKHKSRTLVIALTTKVHTTPKNFNTVVSVLVQQGDWTKDVVNKLGKTYRALGGKDFQAINHTIQVLPSTSLPPAPTDSEHAENAQTECAHKVKHNQNQEQSQKHMYCVQRTPGVKVDQQKPVPPNVAPGIAQPTKLWDEVKLVVGFLNPEVLSDPKDPWKCGDETLNTATVLAWASKWYREGIPRIVQDVPGGHVPHIRVKFTDNERSWSRVGNDARNVIDPSEPTMVLNLKETKTRRDQESMVLHEFGHALGLEHEHQRSDLWDVLKKFTIGTKRMQTGDGGNCQKACDEVFRDPNSTTIKRSASKYDPDSIMHYWFDINWLKPEYHHLDNNPDYARLKEKEKDVIRGIHKRHYERGALPEGPSEADYKFLQNQYNKMRGPSGPNFAQKTQRAPLQTETRKSDSMWNRDKIVIFFLAFMALVLAFLLGCVWHL